MGATKAGLRGGPAEFGMLDARGGEARKQAVGQNRGLEKWLMRFLLSLLADHLFHLLQHRHGFRTAQAADTIAAAAFP